MKTPIYLIVAFIPSDENIVYTLIYKLQSLGIKTVKYLWVSLSDTGGIGTGTDDYGTNSIEEACEASEATEARR